MTSTLRRGILGAAFLVGAQMLSIESQGQSTMDDPNQIPTPIIVSGEIHVPQKELLQKYSEFMARIKEQNKSYKGLNPDSEKITYRNDIGYIFRYEILHASAEEVSKNSSLRSFLVLWTKDFNTGHVATYSGYDFPNPL